MSILIDMEMPKSCSECLKIGWQYVFECNLDDIEDGKRLITCPLIDIPPHGRLIDADKLLTSKGVGTQIAGWGKMYHETCIEYAPTIIPAELSKKET